MVVLGELAMIEVMSGCALFLFSNGVLGIASMFIYSFLEIEWLVIHSVSILVGMFLGKIAYDWIKELFSIIKIM